MPLRVRVLRCGRQPRAGHRPSSKACGARTAQVHRRAIDGAVAGRPFNPQLTAEQEDLARRGCAIGFQKRRPSQDHQNDETGHSLTQRSQFVGEVKAVRDGWAEGEPKNRLAVGDWARTPPPQRQPHRAPGRHEERQWRSDRRGPPTTRC